MPSAKDLHFGSLFTDETADLWTVPLYSPDPLESEFVELLSADERGRAAAFRFDHLRISYTRCRAALRIILSRYLDGSPQDLRFSYHQAGKPYLETNANIKFNLSHLGDLLVLAIAHQSEIGVDVEYMRALDDLDLLAQTVLSSAEVAALNRLAIEQRPQAFYQWWTRKEAYLKATGRGLAGLPVDFGEFSQLSSEPQQILIREENMLAEYWTLHDVSLDPRYAASLSYQNSPRPIRYISVASATSLVELL